MKEYSKQQEYCSRIIGGSNKQLKNFVDNRNSDLDILNSIQKNGMLQRKAFIGLAPLVYAGQYVPTGSIYLDDISQEEKSVIDDEFKREYKDEQEFHDHVSGKPVDCGLIEDQCLWFRLPFHEGFFVLGEQHDFIRYSNIAAASNQDKHKKIIGEYGSVDILHYDSSQSESLQHDNHTNSSQNYYSMDSPIAKLYHALTLVSGDLPKALVIGRFIKKQHGKDMVKDENIRQKRESWIRVVKSGNFHPSRAINGKLFYTENKEEKVYPRDIPTYDLLYNVVDAIRNVQKRLSGDALNITCFSDLATFLQKNGEEGEKPPYVTIFDELQGICESCLLEELKFAGELGNYNANQNPEKEKNASSAREIFMFRSLLKASKANDYAMAAVGDIHLENMKDKLVGIKVIRLSDFRTPQYLIDAF